MGTLLIFWNVGDFLLIKSRFCAASGQINGFILCKRAIYWHASVRELFISIDM